MLFNDVTFLFLFLPLVLFGFLTIRNPSIQLWMLLLASYVFYGSWNYKFTALLFFSTLVDYLAGLFMAGDPGVAVKKRALAFSLVCNLGALGFFKYYNFFITEIQALTDALGFALPLPFLHVVLPVGISFYTFQSMSYTIDVYRGLVKPTKNFLEFAVYVSLFPQLVAGPIVRYKEIHEQIECIGQSVSLPRINLGIQIFLLGLGKKVLIADFFARQINPMFAQFETLGSVECWLAILGYAFQIYFDFSGYSDMAIGLGRVLGLEFPINFNSPYQARNMADFWRRWHITLSMWLRDYLYIPLGGNQGSPGCKAFNVFVVFALGGLWHGAGWTFIVWGIYQGVLVASYHLAKPQWDSLPVALQRAATFLFVLIGWVFFRSSDLPMALAMLSRMFAFPAFHWHEISQHGELAVAALVFGVVVNIMSNTNQYQGTRRPIAAIGFALLLLASVLGIQTHQLEFLYYQF